ncbi:GNAT family N-acetyltransferase [Luteitalea pratensis]|uniref:GNAT family N-acetyltransferase n=1 Tax=Luteitalea pratensis TaxID=1855912 RepID=UPI000D728BEC|nr:GNAT family N-acetyltransferase [Luteitalea pratensis]
MRAPNEIRTSRLLLRPWTADDAEHLLPVLEANRSHLGPWIPARVAEPAPLPVLARRLAAFAADFASDREWRFALFALIDGRVLGEVSLFPRSVDGRVPYGEADRAEIGYWLRADATGTGLASEAAQAMVDLATTMPALCRVEIRCDARNGASAAIARRLGFELSDSVSTAGVSGDAAAAVTLHVWTRRLATGGGLGGSAAPIL